MSEIEYRDIPGHPGYRVGSDGSVWSHRRKKEWTRLGPFLDRQGYYRVNLCRPGRSPRMWVVHLLVLNAFVGPCPRGLEACHGPNGSQDNSLANLRWDTHIANMQDKISSGTNPAGARNPRAKLSEADVVAIRARYRYGSRVAGTFALAREYGMSQHTIWSIVAGKIWRNLPEHQVEP